MLLMRQLLILLVHQQILCHGSWAIRTSATPDIQTPTPLPLATIPLVTASEATLLTKQLFTASSAYGAVAGKVSEAENEIPTDRTETANTSTEVKNNTKKHRYKIVSVQTNCTRDLFEMNIEMNRDFRGLLYAKDFPFECRARGTSDRNVTLRVPTSGCGVRQEPRTDGNMELSVRVMLQMEQKLRQSSDILRTMRCKLPFNEMGMNVMSPAKYREITNKKKTYRNGRMRNFNQNKNNIETTQNSMQDDEVVEQMQETTQTSQQTVTATPITSTTSTPRVRIWLELGGPDGSGAVEVGQATILTVRAIVPGTMGVRVVDCAALDGLETTQQLLDERGCPIDEQVMPPLQTRIKSVEETWSRQLEDDLVEKSFYATFPAFKFPDRERLHVSCGVQLCKGQCPNVNCHTAEKLILSADAHLARIEVFNSLAVTAPQIEVDRLRYDRRFNTSDDYTHNLRQHIADGTLCLSVSKLAISFCVLGFIFLIAVIVALCSLIKSRRRTNRECTLRTHNGNRLQRAEMCTSMFSSSSESAHSARFGSKILIPYYPNTLPYGRVY
ncbi:uncharacterized protein LOC119669800 [Teleopsis dalmanni]|uniref:uncharacterized protein LOC119669800 n=1 Tax=Teleopsis dalmanni TaxID=139649 RepID=UPI0018CFDF29|nr:uncharacterized protein LOC119669800 [Teleopsis dalmanni]